MNKLKLTLDELRVTTFVTATAERGDRGTVLGNVATRNRRGETEGLCPATLAQSCGCQTDTFECGSIG
ncbi:MAG TPA: hypothetical protein VE913_02630 [Longimicrobium sp.]|nr:hypothetical protein [Longimicrobium sp.]